MTDTWGNLPADARTALRSRALRTADSVEVGRRVRTDDKGRVRLALGGPPPFTSRGIAMERMTLGMETYAPEPPPPREVTLIDPETFDYTPKISVADTERAAPIDRELAPLRAYFAEDPGLLDLERSAAPDDTLPACVDHRPSQSPVKNQGGRGTCVSHAALGLLEAAGHIPDDLSEQHAHYNFNKIQGRPHDSDAGLRTTDAAPLLANPRGLVCLEQEWGYIPEQATIDAAVAAGTYTVPQSALANSRFGYSSYKIIGDHGIEGESIKNTRFLESLLALGLDIVVGAWASWPEEDSKKVLRPLLDDQGQPLGQGGHAMLVVGYERAAQYFVVKNSWGLGWGHAGYAYFHYDFMRSCLKYGFTVSQVEPAASS